ncbi:MAG: [Fe-Fe] hydrogenase large subunit C-terminal domain-containing protein [Phycisphaerae bacterium]
MLQNPRQVVYTNKADCRDCHRCLRVCPVKAIQVRNGQAQVLEDRCLACGTCIRQCPQKAKSFRDDLDIAMELVGSGRKVAASLAPSFAALFEPWQRKRMASALRKLGFSYVAETAVGAGFAAKRAAELDAENPDRSHIGTACPAVVSYIRRYEPDLTELLLPLVSPMLAHARHIKATLGEDTAVVFIGPCVAKKDEADGPEGPTEVDCAITFEELARWMQRENVDIARCEESPFDEVPSENARLFPLLGGAMRTAGMDTDLLSTQVVSVSGIDDLREALQSIRAGGDPVVLEPLFCSQGCINGPTLDDQSSLFDRRRNVLAYAADRDRSGTPAGPCNACLEKQYPPLPIADPEPISEQAIREVLERTGKGDPSDQLNCGACGYDTCRDKAVAVIRGLAEPEMCVPQMRRLAEQRTDRIIETSPNGIVILDERLNILSMNPAFRKYFMCSDAVIGKRISYLMDPDGFEDLTAGKTALVERTARHEKYSLLCREVLYALPEDNQYVGIFVNITRSAEDKLKLDELRTQTMDQARELLDHQVQMAQTMARFLGESTAHGEELVEKLMLLTRKENPAADTPEKPAPKPAKRKSKSWLWDTYTSK